jgi:predicted permease
VGKLEAIRSAVRQVVRTAGRAPGFIAAAVLMMALGIGATTAVFSVVNSVLLNPLPYAEPDALVRIVHAIGGVDQPYFNDAVYLTYARNTETIEDLGVWIPDATASITGEGEPEEVRSMPASLGVLTTLGVPPEVGRWFSAAEMAPGAAQAVMLTHGYWLRRFAGDRAVVGRVLTINGRPHAIVGVMPQRFRFAGDFEILLPLRINPAAPVPFFRMLGVARLKDGVTLAQANADAGRVLRLWLTNTGQRDPAFQARYQPALQPLKQDVVGDVGPTLWVLLAAIGIVLLLACANVANLLLVRADARRQEFAIRAALGASWTRLAQQLLLESLVLALLGGALGMGLAYGGLRVLVEIGPSNLPRLAEVSVDPIVLAFALGVSLVSGLLFGLVPILKHARPMRTGLGRYEERHRSQQVLVAAQMALALMLLVAAGLMIRSFQALRGVDPGFVGPEHVQTFTISIPPELVRDGAQALRMQRDVLERATAIPGVASAAFMTRVPMGNDRGSVALTVEGRPDDGRTPPNRHVKVVSPGGFHTLGTRLVAGRDFEWPDLTNRRSLAIVSESLAREYWGAPSAAVGKRVREYYDTRSAWREIVGVVGDVHDDGADQPAPPTIYWPAQATGPFVGASGYPARRVSVVLRTERAGTPALVAQLREAVRSVNPALPLAEVRLLSEVYARSMARTSFTLTMLGIAGVMALALGVSGVYSVIAYAVSRRRREVGIRLALGASGAHVRGLFLRRGLTVVTVGMVLGLGGAAAVTRLMQSLLFGVSPLDPVAFAAMPLVLAVVAVLASYLPARRAAAVDPVETLRAE